MTSSSAISPRVVALGGGHGLATTLSALRGITPELTAIVTVADDGGSSGRLRKEFGIIPPGDLRMALAALCSDDQWGRGWASVVQHRFEGDGPLAGHAVGNLLLAALWEILDDPVEGLDAVASLLRVVGRVLPMSAVPLEISAEVKRGDSTSTVTGQVAVATAPGEILSVSLIPHDPPARPEAIASIEEADWIVVGPGSWYSSVITHLLVPEQRDALTKSKAKKVLILNVIAHGADVEETANYTAEKLLDVVHDHAPDLHFDVVIADPGSVHDQAALEASAKRLGAVVILANVAKGGGAPQHDPQKLKSALADLIKAPGNLTR